MSLYPALVPSYLLLCLLLGGASAAGLLGNAFLQLLAIPLIAAALFFPQGKLLAAPRTAILLLWLLVALFLWQLVPLPPSIWTALPGRDRIAEGFALLGRPLPWLPISLDPGRTIASALWILPPVAIFLAMLRLGAFKKTWLAWCLIGTAAVSVLIGAVQMTGGQAPGWYFYDTTNLGFPTGFFANVNHQATMLLCSLPFLAALYLRNRDKMERKRALSGYALIIACAALVSLIGILLTQSLAGWGLSVPVVASSLLIVYARKRRIPKWLPPLVGVLVAAALAASFASPFGNNLTSAEAREDVESRYTSFTRSIEIAGDFMPTGAGIGTFQRLYPWYEDPAGVSPWYMNHVHNDYIEAVLETGLPGLLLILLFLGWWVMRTWAIWRAPKPDSFAQAATVASAAILAHSLVDYPLRTAAVAAVFALSCALMAEARSASSNRKADGPGAKHLTA
jgi:O-antigen ligase